MSKHFTYYDPHKTYEQATVSWPKESDVLDLTQVGDGNLGFIADIPSRFDVINPILYVCRNKGVIRMNRTVYVEVQIPDHLISQVRRCSNIEFTLSYPVNSFETHHATVTHLLRFPDFLIRKMAPKETPDIDLDELERPLQAGEEEEKPYTPCRVAFEEWIREHDGEIVFESKDGYILAHDRRNLLLVSFFDGTRGMWLADEEMSNGEAPLWFSESAHAESPLYKLRLAAEHFNRLEYCKVLPLTIISDRIEIINAEDMMEEWYKLGIRVCYCHRQEEYVDPFGKVLEAIAKDGGEFRVPSTDNMNELKNEVMRYDKEHK